MMSPTACSVTDRVGVGVAVAAGSAAVARAVVVAAVLEAAGIVAWLPLAHREHNSNTMIAISAEDSRRAAGARVYGIHRL
jgi:hypothetical protein